MLISKQGEVAFLIKSKKKRPYRVYVNGECWYKTDCFDIAEREYEIICHEFGRFAFPHIITDDRE